MDKQQSDTPTVMSGTLCCSQLWSIRVHDTEALSAAAQPLHTVSIGVMHPRNENAHIRASPMDGGTLSRSSRFPNRLPDPPSTMSSSPLVARMAMGHSSEGGPNL